MIALDCDEGSWQGRFHCVPGPVNGVYFFNSRKAMELNGWRCARCRSSRKLEIHHRKYRLHGGTHRVENLEPVCRDRHKIIHRTERSLGG